MDKIKSRTLWLVAAMLVSTSVLAYVQEWPPMYVLIGWVVLISGWFGGKAWASLLEVLKLWVSKGGGA